MVQAEQEYRLNRVLVPALVVMVVLMALQVQQVAQAFLLGKLVVLLARVLKADQRL